MTGDRNKFLSIIEKEGGVVNFGGKDKGKIIGMGKIGKTQSNSIENVLLVDGLNYNLLSISQLCDKGYKVMFETNFCAILDKLSNEMKFIGKRLNNVYVIDFDNEMDSDLCLVANNDENTWLWHRRLGHASFSVLNKLIKLDLVVGLPKLDLANQNKVCGACAKGKQTRKSFKSKDIVSTSKPLELLHLDLFGPSRTQSLGGKLYGFVIVDDYSRFTWVIFLSHKNDAFDEFVNFCKVVQKDQKFVIMKIMSDHGTEFENSNFDEFCRNEGISHNFSAPRTPQQNGVVERKNRTLVEMARTMLSERGLPQYFWAEAISTACHIINRAMVRPFLKKTPYELYKGKKPIVSYFKPFGCHCYILDHGKTNLGKFDSKSDHGIFLGYSHSSRAYRVYNKRNKVVEETPHVIFDESDVDLNKDKNVNQISGQLSGAQEKDSATTSCRCLDHAYMNKNQ